MSFILPNPDPGFNVVVTKEEFNLFYSVDRKLFTRLLKTIGRDSSQAINLMAFFMWLERKSKDMNLVQKLLNNWSDIMLINLCNESAIVLDYMEFSRFPLNFSPDEKHFLPSIQHILRCDDHLTLKFFYDRRLEIITEVTKLVNDICKRAFSDIIEKMHHVDDVIDVDLYLDNVFGASDRAHFPPPPPRLRMQPPMAYFDPNVVPMVVPAPKFNELLGGNDAYNGHQIINQIMANLSLDDIYAADTGFVTSTDNEKKIEMRPIDDRTLFITFSKGYPISENELREYFTREFGDIIETVIMQETTLEQQSLYARLVVRDEAIDKIDDLLEFMPIMKFTINGKHVWARKFTRKFPPTSYEVGTSRVFP